MTTNTDHLDQCIRTLESSLSSNMSGCNPLLLLFAFLVLFSGTAIAAAPAPKIDDRFCQALIKHVPDADVTYQAGLDVHGRAVVPADLPGQEGGNMPLTLPQEITIPLTVDLMSFLNLNNGALPASAMKRNDLQLGSLTLKGDQVLFNGQPLTSAQQDNLAVLCMKPR